MVENKKTDTEIAIEWLKQFDDEQVEQIRWGIENGADVSLYAKPEFNGDQMEEIRWGLEHGVDASLYANPKYSWQEMQEMRKKLEKEKQKMDALDDGKLYRIQLGDYYIGLSKPDNKIHMGYNSEDNKYYQRIFTLPQIYKLDPRLLPLAVEDKEY